DGLLCQLGSPVQLAGREGERPGGAEEPHAHEWAQLRASGQHRSEPLLAFVEQAQATEEPSKRTSELGTGFEIAFGDGVAELGTQVGKLATYLAKPLGPP